MTTVMTSIKTAELISIGEFAEDKPVIARLKLWTCENAGLNTNVL